MAAYTALLVILGLAVCAAQLADDRNNLVGLVELDEALKAVLLDNPDIQVQDGVKAVAAEKNSEEQEEEEDDEEELGFPVMDFEQVAASRQVRGGRGLGCKGSKCRRHCNKKGKNGVCVGPKCVCWR